MKNLITFSMIILPAILFIDIIIMIIMGYITSSMGFTNYIYECTYCFIAKSVFLISVTGYLFVLVHLYSSARNNTLSVK